MERVPLNGFLAVLKIPHNGFAHAGEAREPCLSEAGPLAVTLNQLGESGHRYCLSDISRRYLLNSSPNTVLLVDIYLLNDKIDRFLSIYTQQSVDLAINTVLAVI